MLDNMTTKQKKILAIVGIVVFIVVTYFTYNGIGKNESVNVEENMLNLEENIDEDKDDEEEQIIVHITGAVKNSGVVKLKEGSRIEDAIEFAGGLTEDADITNVNLAYILEDGTKIRIPSSFDEKMTEEEVITEENGEDIIQSTESSGSNNTDIIVNINKAQESELQKLPGIGAALAARIVEYRNQNGKFLNVEDIKNVNGIGENKYENIKDYISI